ncbi:uncharacterized protein MELLADRAFT_91600 [Melampsora larici-populina 98AG31]|uniref:Uncharacterized protein n=1 Tax=Melampsora larici-populina (strain 98AG31 / pathotype 3-4-7) TaxID=747676 RepID=F4RZM3_MELLP|nr:uncharacterized protein MELLADRAFT_91600 [Melampsora larici-populina 98AG31]EGG02165.1 hypothetical protein MELLADRAFT_91600 [Melampsora larici-populina 98AG31]
MELLIIHDAPWVFHGVWKVLAPMLDRAYVLLNLIILAHACRSRQQLKEVGGESTWKPYHRDSSPSQELDQSKKEELLIERKELVAKYIELTNQWIDQGSTTDAKLRGFLALMTKAQGLLLHKLEQGHISDFIDEVLAFAF